MPDSIEEKRFLARMQSQFRPDPNTSSDDKRIAHALEFLAFQSGEINRKLDRLLGTMGQRDPDDDAVVAQVGLIRR